ncbi:MAG: hypothetical protein V3R25_10425, partial [Nitrosomonadaceae bacterium]
PLADCAGLRYRWRRHFLGAAKGCGYPGLSTLSGVLFLAGMNEVHDFGYFLVTGLGMHKGSGANQYTQLAHIPPAVTAHQQMHPDDQPTLP